MLARLARSFWRRSASESTIGLAVLVQFARRAAVRGDSSGLPERVSSFGLPSGGSMKNEPVSTDSGQGKARKTGSGIAIGIALGVAIGAAMGKIGIGIAIGIAIGVAIDASMSRRT